MTRSFLSFIGAVILCTIIFKKEIETSLFCYSAELTQKFQQDDYNIQFERAEMVSYSRQYMHKLELFTYKYNRSSPVVNATWIYKIDVADKLEMVTQVYKFASNEYRLFPIRLQFNFCEILRENLIGLQNILKNPCGKRAGCPILKNIAGGFCNWSPDQARFPPKIPNGKYMLEFQGVVDSKEVFVIRGYGSVSRAIERN